MALKIMKLATKNKFILSISSIFSTIVVNLCDLTHQTGKLTKQLLHNYSFLCRICGINNKNE
ncbi:hypothetical protein EU510_13045 [Pseudoalteromonas sp. FUC4]|uniref:Uncharacterized protein n=1 Tax=Pseudoalteromonas distincta TaxID=77608 RepID=A0A4P9J3F0_9GAMM|nr:hypothetical protein EU510_13045 [Pseudoalteromonas sp. FUC4]KAA1157748.1 hypothetical protein EU511_14565 [Pseudoalteromonas distincta]QCU75383.1 hypothetical protein FFU37_13345 [Pseudoalteromonas distincta]TVU75137.1 hypothetical protein FQP81_10090 [Pseudoalteromonas elyakovii]